MPPRSWPAAWCIVFGSGHSRIMVEEMWPRYGSFPGFNPIVELSLTFHNPVVGANGQRQAMYLENVSGLAERILRNFDLSPTDSALVISSSGCNVVPVEMAEEFRRRGDQDRRARQRSLMPRRAQSRHPRGLKLHEVADLVLDTGAPVGDAMVQIDGLDTPVSPGSTVGGCLVVNCLKAEVAERLTRRPAAESADRRGDRWAGAVRAALRVGLRRACASPGEAVCSRVRRHSELVITVRHSDFVHSLRHSGFRNSDHFIRMQPRPLRTTVIGSLPFPGWLEFAAAHLDQFGPDDLAEMQDDAVIAAIHDQMAAGLDVITDGEQTRLDFNLSFYGFLEGIALEGAPPRRFGPPAHDQRGRHAITGRLARAARLGALEEFRRLQLLAPEGPTLKASLPGPYTLAGPAGSERALSGPLRGDRSAAADRAAGAGPAGRGRLHRAHRR